MVALFFIWLLRTSDCMIRAMISRRIRWILAATLVLATALWWRSRNSGPEAADEGVLEAGMVTGTGPDAHPIAHMDIPPEWMLSPTGRVAPAPRTTSAYDLARLPATTRPPDRDAITRAIYLVREAGARANAGATTEAIALYEQALAIFPRMSHANKELGRLKLMQGQLPEAIQHLSAAIETDEHPGETLNELGIAHLQAGRYDPALAAFSGSANLDPERTESRFNTGIALRKSGRWKEARDVFIKERDRSPGNPRILREIALLDHLEGRPDIALVNLERAIELDPQWYPPRLDAALIFAEQRDGASALEQLHLALNTAPPLVVFQVYSQLAFRDVRLREEARKLEERISQILRAEAERK